VTGRKLTQRLFEAGLLVSRDETRNSNTRLVMADGSRQNVQHSALITFGGGDTPPSTTRSTAERTGAW
jgi:hypothetical protein